MTTSGHNTAADQLKAIVQRVERLETEIKDLNDDKSEIFKEARANGFDVKAIKKVVQKRKLDDHVREEQDLVFDTYWDAIHGTNLVHAHARENIEEFDAETGEVGDTKSPRKAAEAVAEMPRNNPVANVEEEATGAIAAASNDPAIRTDEGGERQHSSTVGFTGDCRTEGKEQSDASAASVGDAAADAHGIPATNSPIAPASQGEAEAPSEEVSPPIIYQPDRPTGDIEASDANTGGSHVDEPGTANPNQAGPASFSETRPATFTLRPNCRNPGPSCAGHGVNHCHGCKVAMREGEAA
jgi:uncharacterized protein (UPF0335 family)